MTCNRLLIVDDEPCISKSIARVARKMGFETTSVTTVEAFMSAFPTFNPTAVFLDLKLSHGDSMDLLDFLAAESFDGIITPMSGYDHRLLESVGRLARARGLMVKHTLQKPASRSDIMHVLEEARQHGWEVTEAGLDEAIKQGHIVPYFQPIYALRDMALVGAEVLARWEHPRQGLVSPGKFIPVAERAQLIKPLTYVIVEQALSSHASFETQGHPFKLGLNISAALLPDMTFQSRLQKVLAASAVPTDRVLLEITESVAMHDTALTLKQLLRLRIAGMELAMDDFGTGYSSLVELQRMPFNKLKIDTRFVRNAPHHADSRAIMSACTNLAHNLGLQVVAEGIEDAECLQLAQRMGVDFAQGFFLGRPEPAAKLVQRIRDEQERRHATNVLATHPQPPPASRVVNPS